MKLHDLMGSELLECHFGKVCGTLYLQCFGKSKLSSSSASIQIIMYWIDHFFRHGADPEEMAGLERIQGSQTVLNGI